MVALLFILRGGRRVESTGVFHLLTRKASGEFRHTKPILAVDRCQADDECPAPSCLFGRANTFLADWPKAVGQMNHSDWLFS